MALAFIVGVILGGLFGGLYMRSLMGDKVYEQGIEENRRIQRLLVEQYKFGIQQGEKKARNELAKQITIRDNMLVTAGVRAGYMDNSSEINLPSGVEGEDRVAGYITTIVDNYIKCDNDMPFDEYIEYLLKSTFGVREHS